MKIEEKKRYLQNYIIVAASLKRTERQIYLYGRGEEILKEQKEYIFTLTKIKEEISLLSEPILREILTQKYLCGLTLSKISDNLGYSLRQTARLHKKALELFIIL